MAAMDIVSAGDFQGVGSRSKQCPQEGELSLQFLRTPTPFWVPKFKVRPVDGVFGYCDWFCIPLSSSHAAFDGGGQLWLSLFVLLFWDILNEPLPGAFLSSSQATPCDLRFDDFYERYSSSEITSCSKYYPNENCSLLDGFLVFK
jgi:hypothetical protein